MSVERNEIFEVYAAPISGGGFPAQIQQILFLTAARQKAFESQTENISSYYTPDLCMGTSGGNVALYIAISGNWTQGGITRVIKSMNPRMFSQTWWPGPMSFIPTWVLGIFEGAVYKPGYGSASLLEAYNKNSITSVEMWNSAFNKDLNRTGLFCNINSDNAYISPFTYSTFEFKTLPLKYLDGNIDEISKTVVASASVPILFKPVEIDGNEYIDGGVTYPSPLTPLQEEIYRCVTSSTQPYDFEKVVSDYPIPVPTPEQESALATRRNKQILHLTYFSSYNIESSDDTKSSLGTGSVFSSITDASAVKDRYTGLNLLLRLKTSAQEIKVIDSRTALQELSTILSTYNNTHYFLEIYVRENNWIDLTKFTPQDILDKMEEAKQYIEYLFYYVE